MALHIANLYATDIHFALSANGKRFRNTVVHRVNNITRELQFLASEARMLDNVTVKRAFINDLEQFLAVMTDLKEALGQ